MSIRPGRTLTFPCSQLDKNALTPVWVDSIGSLVTRHQPTTLWTCHFAFLTQ